jgi:hypothetical protein
MLWQILWISQVPYWRFLYHHEEVIFYLSFEFTPFLFILQ